jgi:uncharacterized membrane protein HdeD (DUF308 family)
VTGRASVELSRTSGTALLRGAALIASGCIAVRWPDETLLLGLVGAGAIATALGLIEIAGALVSRTLWSSRAFYLGDGLVFVGFGVLIATVPVGTLRAAVTLCVTWLLVYVVYLGLLAARVWYHRPARVALLLWALVNFLCALLVTRLEDQSILTLLYWGAFYTALLGFAEVAAGLWINRHFISPSRRDAAAARAGP